MIRRDSFSAILATSGQMIEKTVETHNLSKLIIFLLHSKFKSFFLP
uniref:Uncharacterized protein n=1 Tax=Bartonella rochalimae ATCC BAA-1498 TaxID=685782 RepID=E6YM15_9HYPH|nr:hypothetical protein BARRO_50266 [Bartonella rochalimae ATCC BAA-1498]